MAHRLSSSKACRSLPDQGSNPALAGRFFTPELPGKPLDSVLSYLELSFLFTQPLPSPPVALAPLCPLSPRHSYQNLRSCLPIAFSADAWPLIRLSLPLPTWPTPSVSQAWSHHPCSVLITNDLSPAPLPAACLCSSPMQRWSVFPMFISPYVHRGAGPEHGPCDLGPLPLLNEADSGTHFIIIF